MTGTIPRAHWAKSRLDELADLFQHFSDPRRLQLLLMLAKTEHTVGDLAARLGVTLSAVSHQLRTLRRARLVAYRRDGKACVYSLLDDHVGKIITVGIEHLSENSAPPAA